MVILLLFVFGVSFLVAPARSVGATLPSAEADGVHTVDGEGGLSVFGVVSSGGSQAGYHFEFLPERAYEEGDWAAAISSEGPQEPIEGEDQLVVGGVPAGLSPGEAYRYRLTVKSVAFPGDPQHSGTVRTLVVPAPESETEPACPNAAVRTGPSAQLPDCRAYEQVTPVNKEGAEDIFDYGLFGEETVVSPDGEHVILAHTQAKWGEDLDGGYAANGFAGDAYLFTRSSGGWGMTSLAPQPQTGVGTDAPYSFYTPNLSQALIEREWKTSATRGESPDVEYELGPPGGPYTVVAFEPKEEELHWGHWAGQSRDGSVAVIESPDHELIPGRRTGTTVNRIGGFSLGYDLYEYSGGQLRPVNVETDGETIGTCGAELAEGREGGGNRGKGQGAEKGGISLETGSVNAISSDGALIFFEAFPGGCPSAEEQTQRLHGGGALKIDLYMRVDGAETVDIGHYTFEGANPEGTRLLLSKLGAEGLEYFSYDTETRSAKPLFSLRGDPLGAKHALSENGSVYYFEAVGGPLTPEAPAAASSIYRYDIATETLSFVAVSSQQEGNGNGGFYVSPDGGDFYFNVNSVLGVSGGADPLMYPQVYRYDSSEDVVQCLSCASPFDLDPRLLSTFMPEYGPGSVYRLAPLASPASANGDYVFFDTPSALLPQDVNGEIAPAGKANNGSGSFSPSSDVYEWRREGVDGCGRVQGCLALITNGIDGTENVLLGTDPSGRDVFIGTHSQLTPTDIDSSGDVYDARIGGGFPPPMRLTECEGDECSVPALAPVNPPQLLRPPPLAGAKPKPKIGGCPKGKLLLHDRCVRRKSRARVGPKRHAGIGRSGRGRRR